MKQLKKVVGLMVAMTFLAAPLAVRAESAVPDPGEFFQGTDAFDPQAGGTKYDGTLTISYVFSNDLPCEGLTINNMYVVMALKQGVNTKTFNKNFATVPATSPFCFSDTPTQIEFVLSLVRDQVLPHFYPGCIPGSTCPQFKVKSVSNFMSSGTGAVSTNITIAVQQ